MQCLTQPGLVAAASMPSGSAVPPTARLQIFDRATKHPNATVASWASPRVLLVRDFLAPHEVEHLQALAEGAPPAWPWQPHFPGVRKWCELCQMRSAAVHSRVFEAPLYTALYGEVATVCAQGRCS